MSTHSVSREEQLSLFSPEGSLVRHSDDYHAMHTTIALDLGLDDKIISPVTTIIAIITIYKVLVLGEVQASFRHRDELLSEEEVSEHSLTGFGALKPCGRNKDHTVFVKRPVSKDSLTFKKSKEKEKPKDSMIKEMEKPWPDGKREPKHQQKLTVDEKDGKATITSHGLPSVKPTPSSSFSTKANSGAAHDQMTTFPSDDSVGSVLSFLDRLGKSIGPSLTPAIPAEYQSPLKVQCTKATEKPEFHINTGGPPRTEEHNTEFRWPKTSQSGVEAKRDMPAPRNKTSSRSQPSRHWLLTVLTVMTAAAVSLTADMETFQRNQLVLEHFKEVKVSLANVSEAFSFSSLGSYNEPVTERHCRVIYQQVGAGKWRDVLRNLSMEEVTIENVDAENSTVAEKFYQGLLTWMRSRGTQRATTKKLHEALHLADCSEALEKLSREVFLANEAEAFSFSSLGSDNEPVTERHCRIIYQQVGGGKWRDVLRNLSIEEATIENVDEDYSKVAEKFYQGLLTWMRSRGTQRATTKKLCEALHLAGCSEALEKLSREVEMKFSAERTTFSFDSVGSVLPSVDRLGKSIGPSLTPAIPSERQSPPKVQCTKATEKPEFHINTGKPPRTEEHNTEFRRHKTSQSGVEAKRDMPAPRNKTSSTSQPSRHWLLTVLTVMTAAAVSLTADMETFHRNQLVLGHFMEVQVSLANVSEAFSFSSLGSDNEPVTVKHFRCINHQVGAEKWRDVLRILSMEEVTIENVDAENSTVAERLYQGLLTWMRSRGTQRATTKKLCEALRLPGCSEAFEKLSREVFLANEAEAFSFPSLGSDNEPVTERHCLCINDQVGGKWRDVLRNLSIEEVAIENVDEDYNKVAEKFYQGLLTWIRGTQRATTKNLCEALHLAGCSEALEKLSREVSLANVTEASSFSSLGSDNEPVTERHCHCIYQQVGGKWRDVLRNLSLEEVAIENVDEDYSKVAEKFHQGLLKWMTSRGTQRATIKNLCEALHLAGCSEAFEKLSREGVTSDAPAPIPESTVDLGTYV